MNKKSQKSENLLVNITCSTERKNFCINKKKEFGMSWSDILFIGILSFMKEEQNIMASVGIKSYITAHYTNNNKWKTKKPTTNKVFKTVHIYWINKTFNSKYKLFYKKDDGNGNPSGQLLQTTKPQEHVENIILDQFDYGLMHLLPD